jgi:tail tube protein
MPGIGGGGFVGIAFEVTYGVYVPPIKFFGINSESLHYVQETQFRRPIRQNVDTLGATPGNVHTEGDIAFDCLEDVLPYFLYASRGTVVKSGSTPNFIYTFTPNSLGIVSTGRSLSVTVVRNGVVFGYTGVIVNSFTISIDDATLVYSASVIGSDETTQTLPTPTFAAAYVPYGAGQYNIQIPTATQVFDSDGFEFSVEDNAEPQYRLRNTGRGAQFVKYGERNARLTMERDFNTRTEYDAFKSLTSQSITLLATKGTNNSVQIDMPVSITDTHEINGLTGQGDLIRAAIAYQAMYDPATSKAFGVVVKTQEVIT